MINNHYFERYLKFINWCDAQDTPKNSYTEKHHILPKCFGGSDLPDNIIKLPYRAHLIAHWMLSKAFPDCYQLAGAFSIMVNSHNANRQNFKSLAIQKELSRKRLSLTLKNKQTPQTKAMNQQHRYLRENNPEWVAKWNANKKAFWQSEAGKQLASSNAKSNWADPIFRKKTLEACKKANTPEVQARRAAAIKQRYIDDPNATKKIKEWHLNENNRRYHSLCTKKASIKSRLIAGFYKGKTNGQSYKKHNTAAKIENLINQLKAVQQELDSYSLI